MRIVKTFLKAVGIVCTLLVLGGVSLVACGTPYPETEAGREDVKQDELLTRLTNGSMTLTDKINMIVMTVGRLETKIDKLINGGTPSGGTLTTSQCQNAYRNYEGKFQFVNGGDEKVNGVLSVIYVEGMVPIACGIKFAYSDKPGNLTSGAHPASDLKVITTTNGVIIKFQLDEFIFDRQ